MSQTARVKTVINDLAALKQAVEKLGWAYNEASDKINLTIKNGDNNFSANRQSDGKYEFVAGRDDSYSTYTSMFNKVSQTYAQIKLYKEVNSRSGHGITGLSETQVRPDGSIVIEGEIDETLLVG